MRLAILDDYRLDGKPLRVLNPESLS